MPFARIVEEYENALVRFAARHVAGDAEMARDAVQETFLRLCRVDWRALAGAGHVRPWLYRVCRQRAIDLARKRRPVSMDQAILEARPVASDGGAGDPARVLLGAERREAVRRAVDSLPEREREAVLLKFQDGLSYREISEATGHSTDYVGVLIHRGVRRLRAALA